MTTQRASPAPRLVLPGWMTRQHSAALNWMYSGVIWGVVGTSMGLVLALEFVLPEIFSGVPFLAFSRLRQAHTNTTLYAFASMLMVGTWFYIVPDLCGRRLWGEAIANISMLMWNAAIAVGVGALLLGYTQSREYTEFIYGVDVGILAALILNAIVIYATVSRRTEPHLYVSMWFILATAVLFPLVWFIGNAMWNPPTGAVTGVNDAIINWFYGHNLLATWLTLGVVPLIYYVVPKAIDSPLYSHALGLIAFWTLLLFYIGIGGHHIEWVPVVPWVKNYAIAASIGMIIPTTATLLNIWLTVRGHWNRVATNIPLIFVFTGFLAYILVSYQGTHLSLRAFNLIAHFTHYVPGHAHFGVLLFSATVAMGTMYYIVPRVCHCRIYSRPLAWIQFTLLAVGFTLFFLGFTITGLEQGAAWFNTGVEVYPNLYAMRPYLGLRAVGAAVLFGNFVLFYVNMLLTWVRRMPEEQPRVPVPTAPPLPAEE